MYDCTVVREESIEESYINIITVIMMLWWWWWWKRWEDDSGDDDYNDDKENLSTKLAWEEKVDQRRTEL